MTKLSLHELDNSPVVANNAMNRERQFTGTNSYSKDLHYRLEEFLRSKIRSPRDTVRWLDLCAGRGKALIEGAARIDNPKLECLGVDLVDYFDPVPEELRGSVRLETGSLPDWHAPLHLYDLITCCHGLHYVGDKLKTIENAVSWLKSDGLFIANVDPSNVELSDGLRIDDILRKEGFFFSNRTKVFHKIGFHNFEFPYEYIGGDDTAGPNYTGQPAVTSHYNRLEAQCGDVLPNPKRFYFHPKLNTCQLDKYHDGSHRAKSKSW